jgi:hypothetical protein
MSSHDAICGRFGPHEGGVPKCLKWLPFGLLASPGHGFGRMVTATGSPSSKNGPDLALPDANQDVLRTTLQKGILSFFRPQGEACAATRSQKVSSRPRPADERLEVVDGERWRSGPQIAVPFWVCWRPTARRPTRVIVSDGSGRSSASACRAGCGSDDTATQTMAGSSSCIVRIERVSMQVVASRGKSLRTSL